MTLTVAYDLARSPPTYEFVSFLCAAEHQRILAGEQDLRILFPPGPEGGFRNDQYWPYSPEDREATFENIVLPLAKLLPSCIEVKRLTTRDEVDCWGWDQSRYGPSVLTRMFEEGIRPLRIKAEPQDKLVTITLRQAEHWPERNSNLEPWYRVANDLSGSGFEPVLIRDNSIDLLSRAKLYARAALNLFVVNGPMTLALAMDVPTLICKVTRDSLLSGNLPKYQRLLWNEKPEDILSMAYEMLGHGHA